MKANLRNVISIYFDDTYTFGGYLPPHVIAEGRCDIFTFDEIELMQSTGLKDINGVEIYGGYVITYKIDEGNGEETISATVGLRPPFNVKIPYRDYDETSIYYLTEEDTWDWEVIGNIYENEELLEENAE